MFPDERVKQLADDKESLEAEVRTLKQQLEEEREKSELAAKYTQQDKQESTATKQNGPAEMQLMEAQREY